MQAPSNHDTIAAIATPPGSGGIGIIKISGPVAVAAIEPLFSSPTFSTSNLISHHLYYGTICDPADGSVLDDVLLACMMAPHSFTGDDVVEINCHSGLTVLQKILDLVLASGVRPAEAGEFTRRAFLNGRLDLTQAEAVIDIIESKTQAGLKIASRQMRGALSEKISHIRQSLIDICAQLEACMDFPEDDIDIMQPPVAADMISTVVGKIDQLIMTYGHAARYLVGVDAVIVGKPNVGKSSIMNVLLGDERSIVTNIPGTTRDVIRETITLGGMPVKLHDTAGIHTSTDTIETIGMDKALQHLSDADITLMVFDGSNLLDQHDFMILEKKQALNCIAVINKTDLGLKIDHERLLNYFPQDCIVRISATDHTGIESLRACIARHLLHDAGITASDVLITSIRQKKALEAGRLFLARAISALREGQPPEITSVELQDALSSLGEITGETTSEDILNAVFTRFCIGK